MQSVLSSHQYIYTENLEELLQTYDYSPEIQLPLKVSPTNFRSKKSLNEIFLPISPVSLSGVSQTTLKVMSPKTAKMTRVAMNIPFQFRSDPAFATNS